jgi:hypothetical protein
VAGLNWRAIVNPVLSGKGKRLFAEGTPPPAFALRSTQPLRTAQKNTGAPQRTVVRLGHCHKAVTTVDDSRTQVPDAPQCQLQEVFGCDSVTVG